MVVFGSKNYAENLEYLPDEVCPHCKTAGKQFLQLNYKCFHIWFVFSFVASKKYLFVCKACQNIQYVDEATAHRFVRKNPIPWIRRKGWILFVLLCLLVWGVNLANSRVKSALDKERLSHAQVGDLYVFKFPETGDTSIKTQFGVLKLLELKGSQSMVFAPSKFVYGTSLGPKLDIESGKTKTDDYFTTERWNYSLDELKEFQQTGQIVETFSEADLKESKPE